MGRVVDAETGEGLAAATILIEGTTMGAIADVDGFFVILNVPPGTYTLKATMLGYETQIIKGVRVEADRTIEVNFRLKPAIAGRVEEVVVVAKEPIIKKDVTASIVTVKSEDIQALPVQSVSQVVTQQAGVLERGGLHIRGGRSGEVVYVIDGVEVRDPYSHYTGSAVPLISLEEAAVAKGGFDVDQGSASSGVINVITREGKDKYELTFRYRTNNLSWLGEDLYSFFDANKGDPYYDLLLGRNTDLTTLKDRHRQKRRLTEIAFGGPLWFKWRKGAKFFVSAEFNNHAGRFPYSTVDPENTRYWSERYQWKVSIPAASFKFYTSGFISRRFDPIYAHQWRLALEHLYDITDNMKQVAVGLNWMINPRLYTELRLGYFAREFQYDPFEDTDYDGIDDFADRDEDGFVEIDYDYFIDSLGNLVNIDSIYSRWDEQKGETLRPEINKDEGYVELPFYWWEVEIQSLHPSIGSGPKWWSKDWSKLRNTYGWGQRQQPDIKMWLTPSGDTILQIGARYFPYRLGEIGFLDSLAKDYTIFYNPDMEIPDSLICVDSLRLLFKAGNQYLPLPGTWYRIVWYQGKSGALSLTWRLTGQVTKHHEILVGTEYKKYIIQRYGIDYAAGGNIYMTFLNTDFPQWVADHKANPWSFAAFARDKIEIEGAVIKAGLRFDYFTTGGWIWSDSLNPTEKDSITGLKVIKDPKQVKGKWHISPRIGVSHPITERDVLHFTYGHYFQEPQFAYALRSYILSGAFPFV